MMAIIRNSQNPTHSNSFDILVQGLPMQLSFVFEDGSRLDVPGYDRITIGRELRENHTTIDLTAFDGALNGIARRHVEILPIEGQLTVQDLYSVNGTWLNGEQLRPEDRYPLHDGDMLQLGEIIFIVSFDDTPND